MILCCLLLFRYSEQCRYWYRNSGNLKFWSAFTSSLVTRRVVWALQSEYRRRDRWREMTLVTPCCPRPHQHPINSTVQYHFCLVLENSEYLNMQCTYRVRSQLISQQQGRSVQLGLLNQVFTFALLHCFKAHNTNLLLDHWGWKKNRVCCIVVK